MFEIHNFLISLLQYNISDSFSAGHNFGQKTKWNECCINIHGEPSEEKKMWKMNTVKEKKKQTLSTTHIICVNTSLYMSKYTVLMAKKYSTMNYLNYVFKVKLNPFLISSNYDASRI